MKLYSDEDRHEAVRALEALAVSVIARVEVPAALWRKHRMHELSAEEAGILTQAFEVDYYGTASVPPRFAAVAITGATLDAAAALVAAHALRAYDGVQLACALAARNADPRCVEFACFDDPLRGAATAHGFALVP